jgi:ferredoxin-NADP reductase
MKARDPETTALLLHGCRTREEILFENEFSAFGIKEVHCLSQDQGAFEGRVTDYLKQAPLEFPWKSTLFLLCGNGPMIQECQKILVQGRGVPESHILREAFDVRALKLAA